MLQELHPGMLFFLLGSLVNLVVIWSARRGPVLALFVAYHGMLALAFVRPEVITPGIHAGRGYLIPGPTLAGLLAVLAIVAAALAATRLETVAGMAPYERAMKTAIACFSVFVVECVLAIAAMAWLNLGMY